MKKEILEGETEVIIRPRFYFEVHHPELGDKAHFVIRYLPKRDAKVVGLFQPQKRTRLGRTALMTNFYVHPDHRATGVGKKLLQYLKRWQDTTKTDVVFLVSPYHRNPHLDIWCLKNFYTSHGFPEITGTIYHGRKYNERSK